MTTIHQKTTDPGVLQEYADNRGLLLRVDCAAGVIPGVKLLGTVSRKGRVYPRDVMAKALPLYEGMRVNIDHVEPGTRRSLRDRIGLVRNVTLKEDGLYGDFHFNPKHPLAEQIAWDAENAPQNLGFSHDSRGSSRSVGGKIVVESIDQVLSVNLVANPATTSGLFEDTSRSSREINPETKELLDMNWKEIDIDGLKQNRPDLLVAMQEWAEKTAAERLNSELQPLQEELTKLKAEKSGRELRESIEAELSAAGLDPADKVLCSPIFLEDLAATLDPAARTAKIEDRRRIAAVHGGSPAPSTGSPLLESQGEIPPATAPLARRVARFAK